MSYEVACKNGARGRRVQGSGHNSSPYAERGKGLVVLKVLIRLFMGLNQPQDSEKGQPCSWHQHLPGA